jgi:hypothetical protein
MAPSRDVWRVRERLSPPEGEHLPDVTPIRLCALHARGAGGQRRRHQPDVRRSHRGVRVADFNVNRSSQVRGGIQRKSNLTNAPFLGE